MSVRFLIAVVLAVVLLRLPSAALPQPIELEVACFKGGYGIDFYETCAREFEQAHPGVKLNVWGSPRVWDQLTPRFASGQPPDIIYPGWGLNVFSLIFDNQILCLDRYLAQPAFGSTKPWLETFLPSMLSKGTYQGKHYTVPHSFDSFGWWYNKKMFRENGWKVPKTYDELLALCAEIRKKEIAPVTFTGRYPQYMLDGFFFPWAYRAGGQDIFTRVDKLEPGAWKDPAFMKAARTVLEMKRHKYFQPGCIGMNHTESQMEFLVGRAAMIPNGTWLYSEMKQLLPPGFEMEYMRCPHFTEGLGDVTGIKNSYDGKGWFVSSKSKHPDLAVEYLRYLTSAASARRFMMEKGTMMGVTGVDESEVPQHLREAIRVIRAAQAEWNTDYSEWYPPLGTAVQNGIRDLYNELVTPEQFADNIERAAAEIRNDPRRRKFGNQ